MWKRERDNARNRKIKVDESEILLYHDNFKLIPNRLTGSNNRLVDRALFKLGGADEGVI